jgi:hypothetical protein
MKKVNSFRMVYIFMFTSKTLHSYFYKLNYSYISYKNKPFSFKYLPKVVFYHSYLYLCYRSKDRLRPEIKNECDSFCTSLDLHYLLDSKYLTLKICTI